MTTAPMSDVILLSGRRQTGILNINIFMLHQSWVLCLLYFLCLVYFLCSWRYRRIQAVICCSVCAFPGYIYNLEQTRLGFCKITQFCLNMTMISLFVCVCLRMCVCACSCEHVCTDWEEAGSCVKTSEPAWYYMHKRFLSKHILQAHWER